MALFTTTTIRDRYHNAIVDWQERNFPELSILSSGWDKYFKGQRPFELVAKIGEPPSNVIEFGRYAGQERFGRADLMDDEMFYKARAIITAQCSTELGSIQQHRMSLERHVSDEAKYAIMRIMAEELRHAYQMLWVLDQDATWNRQGEDIAKETIEELLSMEHGEHVLDAFNLDFNDFLDNVVFAAIIDMVGKYQLDMQRAFSYAPMACSMGPMYLEEGFHLGSGKRFTKEIAVQAVQGQGDYSLDDVQRAINKWLPRGLEMFGHEDGGQSNLTYSFKTKTNLQAQTEYYAEVADLVHYVNTHIVRVFNPDMKIPEARQVAERVIHERNTQSGVRYEDLVKLPSRSFFRWRGKDEHIYQPFTVTGELLTHDGKPAPSEHYLNYLKTALPEPFLRSADFEAYKERLFEAQKKREQRAHAAQV